MRFHYGDDVLFICGYEAGCLGFTLYHQLTAHNVKCIILAPTTMPKQKGAKKVKTDKRDAALIARCLAHHDYSPVHIPTDQDEQTKEDYSCKWNGYAVWDEGNGTVDCFYEAEIVIKPTEEIVVKHKELDKVLTKNPFTTKTEIQKLFERSIQDYLESEFKEYCECDDYYQPVVEDFDAEYSIKEWCGKNGFIFISCVGKGSDGGYDPKFRRGWY